MRRYWSGFILSCGLVSNTAVSVTFSEPHWRAAKQQSAIGRAPRFRPVGSTERRVSQVQRFRPKASSRLFQGKQRFAAEPFRADQEFRGTDRSPGYAAGADRQFRPDRRYVGSAVEHSRFSAKDAINQQFRPLPRQSGRYRYQSQASQSFPPEHVQLKTYKMPPVTPWDTYGRTSPYR